MIRPPASLGRVGLDAGTLEAAASGPPAPWTHDRFVALVAAEASALAMILIGWWGASGDSLDRTQVAWLNLSLGGVLLGGVANGLWIAKGRRVLTFARAAVLPDPLDADAECAEHIGVRGTAGDNFFPTLLGSSQVILSRVPNGRIGLAQRSHERLFVVGDRMSRYHREGCVMVVGKAVRSAPRPVLAAEGLVRCEVCEP